MAVTFTPTESITAGNTISGQDILQGKYVNAPNIPQVFGAPYAPERAIYEATAFNNLVNNTTWSSAAIDPSAASIKLSLKTSDNLANMSVSKTQAYSDSSRDIKQTISLKSGTAISLVVTNTNGFKVESMDKTGVYASGSYTAYTLDYILKNTSDNITASKTATNTGKFTYNTQTQAETDVGKTSLKINYADSKYLLVFDSSGTYNYSFTWGGDGQPTDVTVDNKIENVANYSFTDIARKFSLQASTGVVVKHDYIADTASISFKTIKFSTADYVLNASNISFSGTVSEMDSHATPLGLNTFADVYDSELDFLGPTLFAAANTVTLNNQGVSFNAGAGDDAVTGGTGNDTIDGGSGNDTIAGGTGNDVMVWSGGNDKVDGGAGNDVLDLSSFGNFSDSNAPVYYTLEDRTNSTYSVSGKADSFTITNKADNTSVTVAGVETVRIGGEDVSVARFLAPNLSYVTGLDVLTAEFDGRNAPSVEGLVAITNSAAGDLVDLGDLTSQSWTAEQAFNPDGASNTLTFTNASKSTLTSTNTQSSDAKGSSYTAAVKLKSGDAAINFDGSYSYKQTNGTTAGSGTAASALAFTFTDTKGTTDTSDDVASNFKLASTATYSSNARTEIGTIKSSYNSSGYVESHDAAYKFENIVNTSDGTPIQEKQTFTINSYAFSDSSNNFSLKIGGGVVVNTYVQDGQNVDTNTYSLKNVEWNEGWNFKLTTANVSTFMLIDTKLNLGATLGDDFTQVRQDLSDNLLSKLLAEDNIVTLRGGWYGSFDAGAGHDKVTGSFRADYIIGAGGNDTLLGGSGKDTLVGGAGADKLTGGAGSDTFQFSLTDDTGDISWTGIGSNIPSPSFDQIMDFAKGKAGRGDAISLGADQALQVGGSDDAAISTEASINQSTGVATFDKGSGKTLSDAVLDIAARMSAAGDNTGEFAFFKVNNKGSYYAFISDGSEGVTDHDVVVQLAGVTNINQIDLTEGHLRILS